MQSFRVLKVLSHLCIEISLKLLFKVTQSVKCLLNVFFGHCCWCVLFNLSSFFIFNYFFFLLNVWCFTSWLWLNFLAKNCILLWVELSNLNFEYHFFKSHKLYRTLLRFTVNNTQEARLSLINTLRKGFINFFQILNFQTFASLVLESYFLRYYRLGHL